MYIFYLLLWILAGSIFPAPQTAYAVSGAAGIGAATAESFSDTVEIPAPSGTVDQEAILGEGITADGLNLGGMTVSDAKLLVNGHFQNISESELVVSFAGQTAAVTPEELGFTWESDAAIEAAAELTGSGRLVERYKARENLKYDNLELTIPYSYDSGKIRTFVEDEIASKDTTPVDASMVREHGQFTVTEEINGVTTNVDETVSAIQKALSASLSDHMSAEAVVEVKKPKITAEFLYGIQDKLGTYSTSYSSSSSARKKNIQIAAGRLDGLLLMPGESLSVSEAIGERNAENGYQLAPQYENGTSVDSYGGGVCQVSTTLYNAVIRAELQVDKRYPHSMTVHYVPYSSDAAIAEGNKDFVFTNNTDTAIFIASDADGSDLYFSIYGHETRPANRTIEFVSDTLSYTEPKPKEKKDPNLAAGKKRTEGSTHAEVRSRLTKIVKVDGVETERVVINEDHYRGVSKTIYIGTKKKASAKKTKDETKKSN